MNWSTRRRTTSLSRSRTRARRLAWCTLASLVMSFVVSTMPVSLPGSPVSGVKAAGFSTIDSYASFNGSGQYFNASHNDSFNFTNNVTFSAWVRPTSTCFSRYCIIASKENSWIYAVNSGTFMFAFWHPTAGWAWRDTTIRAISGQWQHVVFAKSNNTLTLFVNGLDVYSLTESTQVPNPIGTNTNAMRIGSRVNSSSEDFAGDIDEVRLYNTARTTIAEAQAVMNTWGPANATGLVLYYDFNEGSGTTLNNTVASATSGTALTAVGSPTWSDIKKTTVENNRRLVAFPRSYLTSVGGYTIPAGVTSYHYLVVAGGGGGGARHAGGGGAGGYLTANNAAVAGGDVLGITVGAGGVGAGTGGQYAKGGADSQLTRNGSSVALALGGGRGGGQFHDPSNGGSGGGSSAGSVTPGTGTAGQGNNGGVGGANGGWACTGNYSGWCGGGGGGAGAAG